MLVHQFAADAPLQRPSFAHKIQVSFRATLYAMLKRQKSVETIRAIACNGRNFDRQG